MLTKAALLCQKGRLHINIKIVNQVQKVHKNKSGAVSHSAASSNEVMHRERRVKRGAEVGGATRPIAAAAIMPSPFDTGRGCDLDYTWEGHLTCRLVSGCRGYRQDPLRVEHMLRLTWIVAVWGRGGLLSRGGRVNGGRAGAALA